MGRKARRTQSRKWRAENNGRQFVGIPRPTDNFEDWSRDDYVQVVTEIPPDFSHVLTPVTAISQLTRRFTDELLHPQDIDPERALAQAHSFDTHWRHTNIVIPEIPAESIIARDKVEFRHLARKSRDDAVTEVLSLTFADMQITRGYKKDLVKVSAKHTENKKELFDQLSMCLICDCIPSDPVYCKKCFFVACMSCAEQMSTYPTHDCKSINGNDNNWGIDEASQAREAAHIFTHYTKDDIEYLNEHYLFECPNRCGQETMTFSKIEEHLRHKSCKQRQCKRCGFFQNANEIHEQSPVDDCLDSALRFISFLRAQQLLQNNSKDALIAGLQQQTRKLQSIIETKNETLTLSRRVIDGRHQNSRTILLEDLKEFRQQARYLLASTSHFPPSQTEENRCEARAYECGWIEDYVMDVILSYIASSTGLHYVNCRVTSKINTLNNDDFEEVIAAYVLQDTVGTIYPFCQQNHWVVVITNPTTLTLKYYKSLQYPKSKALFGCVKFFRKCIESISDKKWKMDNRCQKWRFLQATDDAVSSGLHLLGYVSSDLKRSALLDLAKYRKFIFRRFYGICAQSDNVSQPSSRFEATFLPKTSPTTETYDQDIKRLPLISEEIEE